MSDVLKVASKEDLRVLVRGFQKQNKELESQLATYKAEVERLDILVKTHEIKLGSICVYALQEQHKAISDLAKSVKIEYLSGYPVVKLNNKGSN